MDVVQILDSLLLITFLGLILSFNPMLIVVDIVLVLRTKRPIFNTFILLCGFATSVFILFVAANFFIDPESEISLQHLKQNLRLPAYVILLAGGALLLYGIRLYAKPIPRESKRSLADFEAPEGAGGIYLFAVLKSTLSITNIFAILILTRQAVVDNWSLAVSGLAMIWLLMIGFLPLFYIIYLHLFKRQSLEKIDTRLNKYLQQEVGRLIAYALIMIGFIFLIKGLREVIGT